MDGMIHDWGRCTKSALIKWVSKPLPQRLFKIKPKSSTGVLRPGGGNFHGYVGAPKWNFFDEASNSCGCRLHKRNSDFPETWTDPKS